MTTATTISSCTVPVNGTVTTAASTASAALIDAGRRPSLRLQTALLVAERQGKLPSSWANAVRLLGVMNTPYLLRDGDNAKPIAAGAVISNDVWWQAVCLARHRSGRYNGSCTGNAIGYADSIVGALSLLAWHCRSFDDAPARSAAPCEPPAAIRIQRYAAPPP